MAGSEIMDSSARVQHDNVHALGALAAIEQLEADFAHRLDHEAGAGIDELFSRDGEYTIDSATLRGRDAIRRAYAARSGMGPRTVRHLFVNSRLGRLAEGECWRQSVLILFGGDGVPVLPLSSPLAISDVDDHFVRTDNGWRFKSRTLTTVFRGDGKIVSPHSAGDGPIVTAQPEAGGIAPASAGPQHR